MSAGPDSHGNQGAGARILFQVMLISLALIVFEINLIRLFSFVLFFHMAFFALSIALFGLGLGGLYTHLFLGGGKEARAISNLREWSPLLTGAAAIAALFVIMSYPASADYARDQVPGMLWLMLIFASSAAPFFFGSIFLALTFNSWPARANTIYFFDLAGASLGCLFAIGLMSWVGGLGTPFAVAALCGAVTLLTPVRPFAAGRAAAALLCALALGGGIVNHAKPFVPSGVPQDREILFDEWSTFTRITVEETDWWTGWRLSPRFTGEVPRHLTIWQDNRAPAWIVAHDETPESVDYLRYDLTAVPWRVMAPERALVIGAGGGRDLLTGKLFGANEITGVELNATIAHNVAEAFWEYSGRVFELPGVEVVVDNGRTFIKRTDDAYDLIMTSLADTQSAGAQGAYILSENHLYTVQAFKDYWEKLTPAGACAFVTAAGYQNHLLKRMTSSAAQALRELGLDPGAHCLILVTGDWALERQPGAGAAIFFTKEPVSEALLERARAAAEALDYHIAWPPVDGGSPWTEPLRPVIEGTSWDLPIAGTLTLDLSPIYDNRPYLFYPIPPSGFVRLLINPWLSDEAMFPHMQAFHLIVDIFLVCFLFVLALMLSPLLISRRHRDQLAPRQAPYLLIFFCLGAGFILVEIALLQHLFLLLGHPILTFAVTLGIMLFFTGVGSLSTQRVGDAKLARFLFFAAAAAIAVQVLLFLYLPAFIYQTLGYPLWAKFALVTLVLGAVSAPMGMIFPCTMRLTNHEGHKIIPWGWGMNGIGSVLGSAGSTILSINFGIQATFLLGILLYCVVLAVYALKNRRRPA